MKYPDQIKTVKSKKEYTYKEKKSVFIAEVLPVPDKQEVEEVLKNIKKKYYDASHHCYGFKLTDGTNKSSDAGEPGGTAGARILKAIEHFELNNVIVIVIRYFGGVKLGTGPLGKAYYSAAYGVINNSEIIIRELYQKIRITSEFEQLNIVHKVLSVYESRIESSEYNINAELNCLSPPKHLDAIRKELSDKGGGKIKFKHFDEYLYL